MQIIQNLVSENKYPLKCPHAMSPIGICVHNTANDASAKNEISYMVGNNNQTSFHFAVDDIGAVQGLPTNRNGWHAGDGANGDGNRKHIGIEICYSKSGGEKFTKSEQNAAELIAQLLKERGWGIDRVKKHQDFSGKYCPHRTLDLGWGRFLNIVKSKMGGSMPDTIVVPIADWEKVRGNSETLDKTTDMLALPRNSKFEGEKGIKETIDKRVKDAYNQGYAKGKSEVQATVPPTVDGWRVNGMQVVVGDKTFNYEKI